MFVTFIADTLAFIYQRPEVNMKNFGKILRKISRKQTEHEEHPGLRNTLILEKIFHFLPVADIKTATLVCRFFFWGKHK